MKIKSDVSDLQFTHAYVLFFNHVVTRVSVWFPRVIRYYTQQIIEGINKNFQVVYH